MFKHTLWMHEGQYTVNTYWVVGAEETFLGRKHFDTMDGLIAYLGRNS